MEIRCVLKTEKMCGYGSDGHGASPQRAEVKT